ncbi:threonine-phosphate decarboxylase [Rhizobium sp.]
MAGVFHGGGLAAAMAAYGGGIGDWLDLSTGINPEMAELPEISARAWNRLPDADLERSVREAAWDWYVGSGDAHGCGVPPSVLPDISPSRGEIRRGRPLATDLTSQSASTIDVRETALRRISPLEGEMPGRAEGGKQRYANLPLPVPGTQSLIQLLPRRVSPDRPVAILSPTYGEYAHCFRRVGFVVDNIPDLDALRPDHGTLIVVNPNNPTGRIFSRDDLMGLAGRMRGQGGHLHVDEAFGDSSRGASIAAHASETDGVTVSRSFGKFFGLAGLRLGFVFAVPEALDAIAADLGPWPVSGPALAIADHLLRRDNSAFAARIAARAAALERVLGDAGLEIIGGTDLFKLVRHAEAASLYEHLARSHILVRKFDYAGDWLRIGLAPDEDGDRRLADAIASSGY